MTESRNGGYMDEYDEAAPMPRCYCRQLNTEEYERQGSSATERALLDLLVKLDRDPEIYYKILRQKKRDEAHEGGLFSYLKAQFLMLWKGEQAFDVDNEECRQTLAKTKDEMVKVFAYAQGEKGSHGRRCSQRLLEKRKRATHNSKRHLSSESPLLAADSPDKLITRARSHPPPAPPPPPMPEFTKLPANTNEEAVRTPLSPRNSPNLSLARKPLRKRANKGQRQAVVAHDLFDELKGSDCRKKLRKTENIRSPGGTPMKKTPTHVTGHVKMFNQKLIQKFRNVHSPSPGTTSETDTEFNSPA